MINFNKKDILRETINKLEISLQEIKVATKGTKERAIAAPSASESHSDTSKNQLQTLAFGLDQRVYDLETEVTSLKNYEVPEDMEKVLIGSLVEMENVYSGERKYCYVLPGGAGTKIDTLKGEVNIITTKSPIFIAMYAKEKGDEFIFNHNNSKQEYCIDELQ